MTTIPACPPIPTLDELLNSGNFMEVNVNELVQGEFVLYIFRNNVRCIEVLDKVGPAGHIRFRYYDTPQSSTGKKTYLKPNRVQFYRKYPRKNFNDITKKMEERIRNYPEDQKLTSEETIFANKGLSDHIGQFLEPTSRRGGRRKRRVTRRTRKNKRKSTRRIRRKYKK
jgi:hypothetical protein